VLREVDARFLLPVVPRSACCLPGAAAFAPGLVEAGIELVEAGNGSAAPLDLVVASAEEAEAAFQLPARSFLFVGRPVASLARARGFQAEDYLAVPDVFNADFLIPLHRPAVMRYVYRHLRVAPSRARWLRSRMLASALAHGAPPPGTRVVTIAAPVPVRPAALAAAEQMVGPAEDGWLLSLAPAPDGRVVFHVFDGGVPRTVVKCDRLAEEHAKMDRTASTASLAEAIAASPLVASHAPLPLGSAHFDGGLLEAETAAVGYQLTDRLRGPFSRQAKLAAIEAVADWLLALAESTRHRRPSPGSDLAPSELDGVPRVLCHGDLWSGNVIVEDQGGRFKVIDWADVDQSGLPLGDLLFLLSESLAELDGVDTDEGRDRHFVELLTGRHASSPLLFDWVTSMVDALELDPELVGLVAEAAFVAMAEHRLLIEGLAPGDPRREAPAALADPVVRRARIWTTAPGLGPHWQAWRGDTRALDGAGPGVSVAAGRVALRRAERRLGHGAGRLAVRLSLDRSEELGRERILVLAPHPDDETLACGGVLARHAGRDTAFVIVATDGSHGAYGADPVALATRRREELASATAALGLAPTRVACWDLEDGTLSTQIDDIVERLQRALDELRPTIVLSPWALDIHSDHAALGRAARVATAGRALELLEYVTWAWDRPSALVRGATRSEAAAAGRSTGWLPAGRPFAVAIAPVIESKRAAVSCYRSQFGGHGTDTLPGEASLDEALVELFLSRPELFWPAPRPRRRAR